MAALAKETAKEDGKKAAKEIAAATKKIKEWDAAFVEEMDLPGLEEIMMGANYMNVQCMYDMLGDVYAQRIKNWTPQAIRDVMDIKNDLSEEEVEALKAKNVWSFE